MNIMEPSVMFEQVNDLPRLMREDIKAFDWGEQGIRRALTPLELLSLNRVYVAGSGDSYHAALATEMAFESIGRVPCEPSNGMTFAWYVAEFMPTPFPNDPLVVGISASGGSKRTIQLLEKANQYGANTLALTGTAGSAVTKAAKHTALLALPEMSPSPGIRSYQASLIGLLLLAIRIGEIKGRHHQDEANGLRQEIADLADLVEATISAIEAPAQKAAALVKDSPVMMYLGSGPSYGTAMFSAAKAVEAAGLFAVAQDYEEWAHVERFCYPNESPIYMVAPPDRSHWRALEVAETAKSLGHTIIAVIREGDDEIGKHADVILPVPGDVREEFTPLVYHIASNVFAAHLANTLGRKCFQSDNARFWNAPAASANISVNQGS